MNCVELQKSLAEVEDGGNADQRAHLKSCPECSALLADLNLISSSARELRGADEPSPRVWNSIEIALRQEGLIRPQQRAGGSLIPALGGRWAWARWLAPAAAVLLIVLGLNIRQINVGEKTGQSARQYSPASQTSQGNRPTTAETVSDAAIAGLNDSDLVQEVADQTPALQAQYADNLRSANEFIQDAKMDVAANPNDEDARRSLLAAYQQKAMLFELAMDRSLQ
jgi:hypothetical protein